MDNPADINNQLQPLENQAAQTISSPTPAESHEIAFAAPSAAPEGSVVISGSDLAPFFQESANTCIAVCQIIYKYGIAVSDSNERLLIFQECMAKC